MTEAPAQQGPEVPDDETLRRGLAVHFVPGGIISSAAFAHDVFSVEVCSRATRAETFKRLMKSVAVAEFNCGVGRNLGFTARDEPELGNSAHANVYCDLGSSARKRRARELADRCSLHWRQDEPGVASEEKAAQQTSVLTGDKSN